LATLLVYSGLAQITFCGAKALWPFDKRECLSLKQAADVAGKSEFSVRAWCDKRRLGRLIGSGLG
jgi:hypothetical protein